jgi:hypothetical protein
MQNINNLLHIEQILVALFLAKKACSSLGVDSKTRASEVFCLACEEDFSTLSTYV